jgi:hypothetical protein
LAISLLLAPLAVAPHADALTTTLSPNETVKKPPAGQFGSCTDFNLVGAASHWQATSDNADTSYYDHNRSCEQGSQPLKLGFPNFSLPAGAVKKSIRIWARGGPSDSASGTIPAMRGYLSKANVDWAFFGDPQPAGVITTVDVTDDASAWTPQTFAGTEVSLADITVAEINAAEWGAVSGFGEDADPTNDDAWTRVHELYLDVIYVPKPSVTVDGPTGSSSYQRPSVSWTPQLDSDGGSQTRFEAKVFTNAVVTGAGFDPSTSTASAQSGQIDSSAAAWQPNDPLADNNYHAYVRTAQTVNGAFHWSDWASRPFTINTTPPSPTITQPSAGEPTNDTTPSFSGTAGNANGDASDITLKIYAGSQATGSPVQTLTASRSGASWSVTPNTALAEGTYTAQAHQSNAAGNVGQSAEHTFVIDTTGPQTTIDSGPANGSTTNSANASFTFSSSESGSSFACQLDTGTWKPCSSPKSYSSLANGSHTFRVRASDPATNPDPTPAERTWAIDTTPPQTTITAGPSGTTQSDAATFNYTSSESGSSFKCSLDSTAPSSFSDCPASGKDYENLDNGPHTFRVFATDAVGNVDSTPALRSWTVDVPSHRCDDGTQAYDGSAGDAYVKVGAKPGSQGADVCYRFEQDGSDPVSGAFRVQGTGSPGTPSSDQDASSCATAPGNLVPPPHPIREGQLGDPNDPLQVPPYTPYRLDAYANATEAWVCIEVDDTKLRVILPSQPSVVTHHPDP